MNEGILGQIANPQLADVAGALDYRRSQMDKDEAKRKELRMNQLIAQAIPNMAEDSPLREIAQADPQKFAMMAKVLNIPLNEGERFEQLRSRVGQLSALAESDPREAYQYAQRIQAENQRTGIQDTNLDKWLQTVDKDPVTGFNALHVMNQSLNPVKAGEGFSLSEGQTRFDSQGNKVASVEKTYNPNAPENAGVQSSSILDDGTVIQVLKSGGTRVVDPAGNVLSGAARSQAIKDAQAYGADVQASRAGGRAGAIVTGKSQAESVIDLPKIESSSEKVVGLVNELLNHKGKSAALGASSYLPSIRGTDRAGFDNRLKQIQGDAFLKAFESLKGGGAITEIEGQKATQALNRMNETVDEAEFDAAANDFISEVNRFKDIAAQKAGKAPEKGLTGKDKQAYDWAKSNPNDPRSVQILNKLGAQ